MTEYFYGDNDDTLANVSSLTANMSLDGGTLSPGLSDSDDSDKPNHSVIRESPPSPSRRLVSPEHRDASPPLSPRVSPKPENRVPVLPEVSAFRELAADLVDSDILKQIPKIAVILSPSGYDHVFSRNWVSKRAMASVVERPERLKAAALGIGLTQTKVPVKLMSNRRRTSLYAPHFEAVHGKDWATELYALCSQAASKLANQEIEVPESWPYYDMYISPNTAEALEGNIAALELGIDEIFKGDEVRRAFVTVRPPGHHCHEEEASGFCIINNAHIAIQYARKSYAVTHAVILDFDLHHGDGSQDLLWKLGFKSGQPADLPMAYFSIHDINSFPSEAGFAEPKQIADASVCFLAHNTAIWNVHLKPYNTLEEFDRLYSKEYSILFEKAAEFLDQSRRESKAKGQFFKPLVVVSAGFDGSEFETPGMQRHQVNVPTSFYNRFTRDCVALSENYGSGYLLSVLEGGYSSAAIATGVFSHLTGLSEVEYLSSWCPETSTPHEIDMGMRQRWRLHPEQWSANGIALGRTLFPQNSLQTSPPSSSEGKGDESRERSTRRRAKHIS